MTPGHSSAHLITYIPQLEPGHSLPHPGRLRHNQTHPVQLILPRNLNTPHLYPTTQHMTHNRLPKLRPQNSELPSPTPSQDSQRTPFPGQITAGPKPPHKAPDTPQPPSPRAHSPPLQCTPLHPTTQPTVGQAPTGTAPGPRVSALGDRPCPNPPRLVPQLTGQEGEGRGPEQQQQQQQERSWEPGFPSPRPGQRHGSTLCSEAMGTGRLAGSAPPSPSNQH